MTSFYHEIERARSSIERHVGNLLSNQESLDEEYDVLFEGLLTKADEFDAEDLRAFRKLGQLRRLKKLNMSTVLSLQYLRMCIWLILDGLELDEPPNPAAAIKRLREVNEALAGSSRTQVNRLDRSVAGITAQFVARPYDHERPIRLALSAVDEDVARIFGDAVVAVAQRNGQSS